MASEKPGLAAWAVLGAIFAVMTVLLLTRPLVFIGTIGGLGVFTWVFERKRNARLLPVAIDRHGEDIGTFARAFDRHARPPIDPWAIRAVWNALSPLTNTRGTCLPLRPTDRIERDLEIDAEDVEELVPGLVEQCERSLDDYRSNPFYRELDTVGGLVRFISAQPKQNDRARRAL